MATTLVTGGAGFIGTAVVEELVRAGHHVAIAGTSRDPLNPDRIAAAITAETELVVHCAGSSSVAASVADPAGERAKTVPPFAAVLERVRAVAPHARVVLVSSAAVYGATTVVPTPETAPLAPLSPYGEDKRACEALCQNYTAAIVRLFSVYGSGLRKQLLWDACHKAKAGTAMFAGTGDEQRDWLHVADAATLIIRAAEAASIDVPVFNGGAGVGVRVRDVVGPICRAFGVEPTFSGASRIGDPPRYVADIARARSLGWAPTVELAHGIADYVAWFRANA